MERGSLRFAGGLPGESFADGLRDDLGTAVAIEKTGQILGEWLAADRSARAVVAAGIGKLPHGKPTDVRFGKDRVDDIAHVFRLKLFGPLRRRRIMMPIHAARSHLGHHDGLARIERPGPS